MTTDDPKSNDQFSLSSLKVTEGVISSNEILNDMKRLATIVLKTTVAMVFVINKELPLIISQFGLNESLASQQQFPLPNSIVSQIASTKPPLIISDIRTHPITLTNSATTDIDFISCLGIPLTFKVEESQILFCVFDNKARDWTAHDIDTLKGLSTIIGHEVERNNNTDLAIGKSKHFTNSNIVDQQSQMLTFINNLTNKLYQAQTSEAVANIAVDEVMKHWRATIGAVYLFNPKQNVLELIETRSLHAHREMVSREISLDKSLAGEAIRTSTVLNSYEMPANHPLQPQVRIACQILDVSQIVIIPMLHRDSVIGTLNLGFQRDVDFNQSLKDGLYTVATSIGLAVANAKTVDTLLAKEQELRMVKQLAKFGSWEWDLSTQVITWTEEVYRLFGVPYGTPLVFDDYASHVHPDDTPENAEKIVNAIEGDTQQFYLEHRFINESGEVGYMWVNANINRDEDGNAVSLFGTAQDVTEAWYAEQSLRESEKRFHKAFIDNPAAMIISKADSDVITDANSAFLTVSGYQRHEVINRTPAELELWIRPKTQEERIQHLLNQTNIDREEIQLRTKHDEQRAVYVSRNIIEFNNTNHNLTMLIDVTEQKRAEDQLRQREKLASDFQRKLRALHAVALDLGRRDTLDALYQSSVTFAIKHLGFERMQLVFADVEKSMLYGVYGSDEHGRIQNYQGTSWQLESDSPEFNMIQQKNPAILHDDASIMSGNRVIGRGWVITALLDNGQNTVGYITTDSFLSKTLPQPYFVDIMALYGDTLGHLILRKRTELELQLYIERLQVLHELDQAILLINKPEKIAEEIVYPLRKLLDCNFIAIAQYNSNEKQLETIASTIDVLDELSIIDISDEDLQLLLTNKSVIISDLEKRKTLNSNLLYLLSQGIMRYTVFPLIDNRQLLGIIVINNAHNEPLTEQQTEIIEQISTQLAIVFRQAILNEQLQKYASNLATLVEERTAQLQAKTQELEAFNYSVSHDLRTPLRAITAFSNNLQSRYQSEFPEKALFYLQRIEVNAVRMGILIENLLELSRLGRTKLDIQPVDMTALVKEIVTDITKNDQLGSANITISNLHHCHADRTLIHQVWTNLIYNALKYSSREQTPEIEIGSQINEDNQHVYFIKDNGVGFDMAYYSHLFGVFERLVNDEDFEGTGIGLAITKRVVIRHNGNIWAESALNNGAKFYFTVGKVENNSL